jgi:hypothetical protein
VKTHVPLLVWMCGCLPMPFVWASGRHGDQHTASSCCYDSSCTAPTFDDGARSAAAAGPILPQYRSLALLMAAVLCQTLKGTRRTGLAFRCTGGDAIRGFVCWEDVLCLDYSAIVLVLAH